MPTRVRQSASLAASGVSRYASVAATTARAAATARWTWSARSSGTLNKRKHAIPHQLVDHAAVLDHGIGNDRQVGIEQPQHPRAGRITLGQRGEAFDVGEHCRHQPAFAVETQDARRVDQPLDDVRRQMLLEIAAAAPLTPLVARSCRAYWPRTRRSQS